MGQENARGILEHLRLKEEKEVDVISWPAGAGKTRAALQDVIRAVKAGSVVLWLTPTVKVLQEETRKRATGESGRDGFKEHLRPEQVECINYDSAKREGGTVRQVLSERLNEYLCAGNAEGRLFLASWPGYLIAFGRLKPWVKQSPRLRLVVDEMPQVVKGESREAQCAEIKWGEYLNLSDRNNLRIPAKAEERDLWWAVRGGDSRDAIVGEMRDLAEGLTNPAAWLSTLLNVGATKAHFLLYLRPEVLALGGQVEILAANAEDSYLLKVFRQCGMRFRVNGKYKTEERLEMKNGCQFTIAPLQEKLLSKAQYRNERSSHPAGLGGALVERAAEAVREFYGRPEGFIYCLPRGAPALVQSPEGATRTEAGLHGSNAYDRYLAAAHLAAMNWDSVYAKALRGTWGFTKEELRAGLGAEAAYQYAMRIKGRRGELVDGEEYLVIVGDLETANALRAKIPDAAIELRYMEKAEKGSLPGGRGDGTLGSLSLAVGKSTSNRLYEYRSAYHNNPTKGLSRTLLKRLGDIGEALGEDRELFTADFLKVAKGEAEGRDVFHPERFGTAAA